MVKFFPSQVRIASGLEMHNLAIIKRIALESWVVIISFVISDPSHNNHLYIKEHVSDIEKLVHKRINLEN